MRIAIIVATYLRKNGLSKQYLERCLTSIRNQTNQNFKLFLIGDDYENKDELFSFSTWFSESQLRIVNLEEAYERSRYRGYALWCVSPLTPMNKGIDLALEEGFEYMCFLDDDDYYLPNHIDIMHQAITDTGKNFIHTLCKMTTNDDMYDFPSRSNMIYEEIKPACEKLAKSSVCINFKNIKIRPRNVFEETGRHLVYDCDLWDRIGESGEMGIKVNLTTIVSTGGMSILTSEI